MYKFISRKRKEKAQGLVEYALILVLVAVVVIVVLALLGPGIGSIFSTITDQLAGNGTGGGGGGGGGGGPTATPTTPSPTVFSGTITAGSPNDGLGRWYANCSFTVSTTGSYKFGSLTTNKPSQFWVTGASNAAPCCGWQMYADKGSLGGPQTLTAGTPYHAFPHSTFPPDFPVSYQFTITGPGTVSGSCP